MERAKKQVLALILLVAMCGACATPSTQPVGGTGQSKSIVFADAEFFDSQLANSMKEHSSVVSISFMEPVTLDSIPARLDKWLYVLTGRYKGSVDVKYDPDYPAPKDVTAAVYAFAAYAYSYLKEYMLYRPVQDYNAVVYVVPGKKSVTRVRFVLKQGGE